MQEMLGKETYWQNYVQDWAKSSSNPCNPIRIQNPVQETVNPMNHASSKPEEYLQA